MTIILKPQKQFVCAMTLCLLLATTGCGSSFSEKDLAACQSAWDSTSDALSSAPRATYSDSAPDPTFEEKMDYFMVLVDAQSKIRSLGPTVDSPKLNLALLSYALGIGAMSLEFLENPRGRGTPGITQFNDTFKVVLDLCESSGWKN